MGKHQNERGNLDRANVTYKRELAQMEKLALENIDSQSFVDAIIDKMDFDLNSKNIEIHFIDGYYISNKQKVLPLKRTIFKIQSWESVKHLAEDVEMSEYKKENPEPSLVFSTLCEIINDDTLSLRGFSKGENGCWIEWIFNKPEVTIYGEMEED